MRIKLLLATAFTASLLGACAQDPFQHGPFLVGAERPHASGACCRPGTLRSQDVSGTIGDNRPCHMRPPCFDEPATQVIEVITVREETVAQPQRRRSRSAWD